MSFLCSDPQWFPLSLRPKPTQGLQRPLLSISPLSLLSGLTLLRSPHSIHTSLAFSGAREEQPHFRVFLLAVPSAWNSLASGSTVTCSSSFFKSWVRFPVWVSTSLSEISKSHLLSETRASPTLTHSLTSLQRLCHSYLFLLPSFVDGLPLLSRMWTSWRQRVLFTTVSPASKTVPGSVSTWQMNELKAVSSEAEWSSSRTPPFYQYRCPLINGIAIFL